MHIEPHLVAQSVGHEERVGTGGHGVVDRSADESQRVEPLDDHARRGEVDVDIANAGCGEVEGEVIGRQHYLVDFFLARGKSAADRYRASEVTRVAACGLGSGVD